MKISSKQYDEMLLDYLELWNQHYVIINKKQNTYLIMDTVNGGNFELSIIKGRIHTSSMDDCINNAKKAYYENIPMLKVIHEFEEKWYA